MNSLNAKDYAGYDVSFVQKPAPKDDLNSILFEGIVETAPATTGIQQCSFYVRNQYRGENTFFVEAHGIQYLACMSRLAKGMRIRVTGRLLQNGRFSTILADDVSLFKKAVEVVEYSASAQKEIIDESI